MKTDKKRFLKHYFPELAENPQLPVNFAFTQFYALHIDIDEEEGKDDLELKDRSVTICVDAYQTSDYHLLSTGGKPISKIIS